MMFRRFSTVISIGSLLFVYYLFFAYASPYAATWDQVDFALALDRYDLFAMQPHFPGYPYFILGGMLVHSFVENPAQALAIWNGLFMVSATVPIFLLAKQYVKEHAWLLTALIQSLSYVILIVTQPMSEGAAIAVLWWYIWSLERALHSSKWSSQLLPLFLFSVMVGIRLSYFPFGVGILYVWWKTFRDFKRVALYFLLACLFQFFWIGAVAATEGGITNFIKLALSFTSGHFEQWGGAISTDEQPFWHRLITLVFYNIIWTGMACQSVVLLIFWGMIVFFNRGKINMPMMYQWFMASYFLWALFAQNIDKPRHIVPFVGMLAFFLFVRFFRSFPRFCALAIIVLMTQLVVGANAVHQQATQLPAVYQLAYDFQEKDETFVMFTWEETRVLQYLNVSFPHERVFSFDVFKREKANYPNATVYVTDHVIKGFQGQGMDVSKHIRKIKTYHSSRLLDPVYGRITVYEWTE
jgi:hypothetical protein